MILLVDDDRDDVELFQEVLERNNYSGESVHLEDGQELMDFLRVSNGVSPKLIMLDLNMPVKNGFEALKEIKTDSALQSIPVAILSASSNEKDKVKCVELGCNMYFKKPHSMEGYTTLIKSILNFLDHPAKA